MKSFLRAFLLLAFAVLARAAQPIDAPPLPLDDLRPGQRGEVWTVFRGTEPEPFSVVVTGVLRNALGPGKAMIVCELTDDRVQKMGAVAGMSGSPLYIDGKLAGALSYQIQRFETVRFAGFTPVADLTEVRDRPTPAVRAGRALTATPAPPSATPLATAAGPAWPLAPAFTLSGLSPAVAELFAPHFAAVGLATSSLGGTTAAAANSSAASPTSAPLRPGSAVAVALATGDITLAGTGTVSRLDGDQVTAFGHPMMSLGDVALPMCAAEIVTILPSTMSSQKLANTGAIIGTVTQDRLSGISGRLGAGPDMTAVEITVAPARGAARTLRFQVARQVQLTPLIIAAGITQSLQGANDAGFTHGFRLRSNITFRPTQTLALSAVYAGPQGFTQGLTEFVQSLAGNLQNPYEQTFPDRVAFTVEPLAENPTAVVELFQLSRGTVRPGESVQVTLGWRDFQGAAHREIIDVKLDPAWTGKRLDVILTPGRALDELAGRPRQLAASELRSFGAYLQALRDNRPTDGLIVAVVEGTDVFTDQTIATPEAPGSIERIARHADEARFRKREAVAVLWERHVLAGKVAGAAVRRPLRIVE